MTENLANAIATSVFFSECESVIFSNWHTAGTRESVFEDSSRNYDCHTHTEEFDFIAGQLIPHGVAVEIAEQASRLAKAQHWDLAFYCVEGNFPAVRILQRIRELRQQ